MMDLLCIIAPVQDKVKKRKGGVTGYEFLNKRKDEDLVRFIRRCQKGDKRYTAHYPQTVGLMTYWIFVFMMTFA